MVKNAHKKHLVESLPKAFLNECPQSGPFYLLTGKKALIN